MFFLLLVYFLIPGDFGDAVPIPSIEENDNPPLCNDLSNYLTKRDIIWGCISTILLCSWVSLNPNIPAGPRRDPKGWFERRVPHWLFKLFMNKLPLFLCALLAPEYILAWAIRQNLMARHIQKEGRNIPGWTRTHGFFLIMGGFHLYRLPAGASYTPYPAKSASTEFVLPLPGHSHEDEEAEHPLGLEHLKDLSVEALAYIIPTETKIKDSGKADPIAKTLVLFQTVWFVMQCIARGIAHLPLTELEILTIAYSTMNLFIYYFWWDKPKDVECPIRVYKTATGEPVPNGKKAEWGRGIRLLYNRMFYIPGEQDIFFRLTEERQVPIFWSGKPGRSVRWSVSLWASLIGAGFGAVHFIAWNFVFPTHIELLLWRISCIAMTAIPLLVSAESIICMIGGYNNIIVANALLFASPLATLAALLYIFTRMAILVIAFTTLRSLQSDGLKTVQWTSFLPHI